MADPRREPHARRLSRLQEDDERFTHRAALRACRAAQQQQAAAPRRPS